MNHAAPSHNLQEEAALQLDGHGNLRHLLTIRQHKGGCENLIVSIVGNIRHSRVAMSISHGLAVLDRVGRVMADQ